ncbi:MAG: amino acid kinase family protein [Planctomycetota bacterium]
MNSGTKVVVALGGNALVKTGQRGTVYEQFANARTAILHIVKLVKMGYRIILTHGNGPQVGNILIRVKEALGKAYEVPLGVAVAEAQGEMGYMIEQTLQNRLILERIRKSVVTVLTQVVCARDDPSLGKPEKPIGPFYSREEAGRLMAAGLKMIEDSGHRREGDDQETCRPRDHRHRRRRGGHARLHREGRDIRGNRRRGG